MGVLQARSVVHSGGLGLARSIFDFPHSGSGRFTVQGAGGYQERGTGGAKRRKLYCCPATELRWARGPGRGPTVVWAPAWVLGGFFGPSASRLTVG